MKIGKNIKNSALVLVFAVTIIAFTGCGGVSDTQMLELNNLKAEVNSLQAESETLKLEREELQKSIAEKNAKLEECKKVTEETKANLNKMKNQ
jgi:peptidoglycan hydrolase CwlO-like protein